MVVFERKTTSECLDAIFVRIIDPDEFTEEGGSVIIQVDEVKDQKVHVLKSEIQQLIDFLQEALEHLNEKYPKP